VLKAADGKSEGAIDAWMASHQGLMDRVMAMFDEFKASEPLDLSMLAVANRQMRSLIVAGSAEG
jgi:NAD-specific glutamate dehydrogenase